MRAAVTARLGKCGWLPLVVGYAVALLLCPPGRDFAILDDWIYLRSVADLFAGGGLHPADYAQVTLVTHTLWGATWAAVCGYSFTALTYANLAAALVASLACYALLRQLAVSPRRSLLGAALLSLNPLFVLHAYSYMTDITYLACLLLATLLYLKGTQRASVLLLLLASLCAALAFLSRQFGLALPLVVAAVTLSQPHLQAVGGSIGKWRRLVAVLALPGLAAAGYLLWRSGFGPSWSSSYQQLAIHELVSDPLRALVDRALYVGGSLPLLGLSVPLWGWPRRRWLLLLTLPVVAAAVYFAPKPLPLVVYPEADSLSPFGLEATPLWWLGLPLAALLCANLLERGGEFAAHLLAAARWHRSPSLPASLPLTATAALTFAGTVLVSRPFFSRYYLVLLPALIYLAVAERGKLVGRERQAGAVAGWQWGLLAALAVVSFALHTDSYAYNATRWRAGRDLLAHGVAIEQVDNGYAWAGYYLYEAAVQRLGSSSVAVAGIFAPSKLIDPLYIVGAARAGGPALPLRPPVTSYRVVARYHWFSLLAPGWQEVVVWQRQ